MDVKEAIARAKSSFTELFIEETITEVGLEEVEYDAINELWKITIGFAREKYPLNRWYKVVVFEDKTGNFVSIKNRESAYT